MIEHDAARVSLVDLVVPGLVDPTRTAALRGHVATCEACQDELADLAHLHHQLREAGPVPHPPDRLRRRVLTVSRRDAVAGTTAWRTAALVLAGVCAVLTALLVIALIAT